MAFSVTTHSVASVMFEEHALDGLQLRNCCPWFGSAISVTSLPGAKDVPVGCCRIVPPPTTLVVRVTFVAKFADAFKFWFRITVQVGTLP